MDMIRIYLIKEGEEDELLGEYQSEYVAMCNGVNFIEKYGKENLKCVREGN